MSDLHSARTMVDSKRRPLDSAMAIFADNQPSAATRRTYIWILREFLSHCHGVNVWHVDEVELTHVVQFLHRKDQCAPASLRLFRAAIASFFSTSVREGWAVRNVAQGARPPRLQHRRLRSRLDVVQQRKLIGATVGLRDRALILVVLATGARVGELVGAAVDDWNGSTLRLYGKTGERFVPLLPKAAAALDDYLSARGDIGSAPLIAGRQGRLSTRRAHDIFRNSCRAAGLPPQGPHQGRHAAAMRWLQAGTPISVVSSLLGHSSVSTTVNHYMAVGQGMLEDAVARDPLGMAA